nr:putative ribonuclease H-like domain-containing protein [Tanacetum cinerariifolium]
MDLKWQVAMLTMRARRSPKDNRNKDTPRRTVPMEVSTSNALVSQCDEVAPCSKACSKAYATLQSHYDRLIVDFRKSQIDVLSYKTGLESVEARLVVYQHNENVFKEDIKLLKLDVMLRDNALLELRKKFEKAKKERDELKHTLEKFHTSSKNLSKLLESQTCDKTGLGYDSQVFNSQVFDYDELNSFESDASVPTSPVNDRYKSGEGYHAVPPSYTGTFMPPKPNLVFHDAPKASETITNLVNVESSSNRSSKDMSKTLRTDALIIEDWTSDSEDEFELDYQMVQKPVYNNAMRVNHHNFSRMSHPYYNRNVVPITVLTRSGLMSLNAAKPVSTAIPQTTVKSPWPVTHVVNKAHSPIRKPINHRPATKNSNFNQKVTTIKVTKGNPQQALKDKGVIDSGCSRHMTRNIYYLFDFEEFNGGYVAFGGNPKGSKISGKGNQPNHNAGNKKNLDAGKVRKETVSAQQYVLLPLWSTGSQDPQKTDDAITFYVKENENKVHVSPSGSDKTKKYDDKAKRADKEKNMPTLEDTVYSDNEEDVGAEANFSNLQINIFVSRILTTRVYKDYPITQIIDLDYPDKVYKVVKALYGLHQAPRAWYETLANYLLENGFQRGMIDQTLFIKKQKGDIMLAKDKFQMSSIGQLTFFLGLQVKQKDDRILINQDKYVAKILRKFSFTDVKSGSTPIEKEKPYSRIMMVRHNIRPFIWSRIRNGLLNSAWFDLWCSLGNLSNIISNRDIYSVGFHLDAKVADLIHQDEWVWPGTWYVKYPLLANV